jgi:hypothetical protein
VADIELYDDIACLFVLSLLLLLFAQNTELGIRTKIMANVIRFKRECGLVFKEKEILCFFISKFVCYYSIFGKMSLFD